MPITEKPIIPVADLVQHLLQTGLFKPFEGYLLFFIIVSCVLGEIGFGINRKVLRTFILQTLLLT